MAKIKLEKGKNYQICANDGVIEIRFYAQNKVFKQTLVNDALSEKVAVALCDEEVALFNGETLKRSNAELFID